MRHLPQVIAFSVVLLLAHAPAVFAHAFPDHSLPAVGGTITGSPKEVDIWFTQELEPAFSTLKVFNQAGQQVDLDPSTVDAKNAALLRVAVKDLPPGTYKVVWHAVSVDTHVTDGNFTFTVTK